MSHHFQQGKRDIPEHGDVGMGIGRESHQHGVLLKWTKGDGDSCAIRHARTGRQHRQAW
jgi:hypothetical protein